MEHGQWRKGNAKGGKGNISPFFLLLGFGVLLWVLAYQVPFHAALSIGGDPATHKRGYDSPFLQGFNASEPDSSEEWRWWTLPPYYPYRWTTTRARVDLPGVGGSAMVLTLVAASGRPGNSPTTSTWQVGEGATLEVDLPAAPRSYHVLARPDLAGSLHITMQTPRYDAPDDPRSLGFVLRGTRLTPLEGLPRLPALAQVGWLALALALLYPLVCWLGPGQKTSLLAMGALVLLAAFLLVAHRFTLTLFMPKLCVLLVACWLLALLVWGAGYLLSLPSWRGNAAQYIQALPLKPLFALALLAFALRLGGMLHPYARFSDHVMNANNLLEFGLGKVYFTEGLPAEAGGGKSPYPPGSYLLAAPAQLALPGDVAHRVLVVQSSAALFDSLVVVGIGVLLGQAGARRRAALAGAALYVLPAPMMVSFSAGEYANIGGQVLALPLLALLALAPLSSSALFVAFLGAGLLGHMGVALSLTFLLVAWWGGQAGALLVAAIVNATGRATLAPSSLPFRARRLLLVARNGLLAAVFAGLFYYSAPQFVPIFAERLTGGAAPPLPVSPASPASLWQTVATGVADIAGKFLPISSKLSPILVWCGLVGALLLWQRAAAPPPRADTQSNALAAMLLAWWGGLLISLSMFFFGEQSVRWEHFLYPALCLGAGPLLAAFWQRGSAGRLVGWCSLLIPIVYGLTLWVARLQYYLH